MKTKVRLLVACVVLLCYAPSNGAEAAQDQAHYRGAVANQSTSPFYVHITIKDDRDGSSATGCVGANFLVGAIFSELGGDAAPRETQIALLRKAHEIALNSTDHEFHFANSAALANVRLEYTEGDLTQAEAAVKSIGLNGLTPNTPEYQTLGRLQWSAALACAIIEKGWSARRADITGQIIASP